MQSVTTVSAGYVLRHRKVFLSEEIQNIVESVSITVIEEDIRAYVKRTARSYSEIGALGHGWLEIGGRLI